MGSVHHHLRLLLMSILAVSHSCSAAPPPVYDTNGHELIADERYYVLAATPGHGGGLTIAPHLFPCPLLVAQEANERRKGFPVRIVPREHAGADANSATAAPSDRTVRLSTDVRVEFEAVTTCVQSTEWHIGDEPFTGSRRVVTGPVLDPSASGRESVFRVEKLDGAGARGYKLVSCRDSCQDLGVVRDRTGAWLGATEPPLVVVFQKAKSF